MMVSMTGLTPGIYTNRTGRYEVDREGRVWLIGGSDLQGQERREVKTLPSDAAMTAAAMRAGSTGGTTTPGAPQREPDHESDGAD